MDIEKFREHCLSLGEVTEKTPFGKFAARYDSLLVFYVHDHMFCIIDINDFKYVDVRSTAEEIDEIKQKYSSVSNPINKALRYWLQIDLGGDIPDETIMGLVDRAYEIIKSKYEPKAGKRQK